MKMPSPRVVLVLYLMGFFSGALQTQELPLDMATTSFDDQYDGCVAQMEEKVGGLQSAEFARTPDYAAAWDAAAAKWNEIKATTSVPTGFKKEYAIAVLAYTNSRHSFYKVFNEAVRKAGKSEAYYLENFQFKSFHFFLTRALQVLWTTSNTKRYSTFRGVHDIRFIAERSKKVRFGSFTSSSLEEEEAKRFWDDTFFTIETHYGSDIAKYSFKKEEAEVLIPPYELFRVELSTKMPSGKIRIRLTSAGKLSNYNCVYVKGSGLSHLHADARMPFLFWGLLLMAGALGVPGFL